MLSISRLCVYEIKPCSDVKHVTLFQVFRLSIASSRRYSFNGYKQFHFLLFISINYLITKIYTKLIGRNQCFGPRRYANVELGPQLNLLKSIDQLTTIPSIFLRFPAKAFFFFFNLRRDQV